MFLPQSPTMHQLLKRLCSEYQCRWEKIQSKQESKVWLIDNTVVMVYQGEPRRDLWVDSRAVLRFSDEERKGNIEHCKLLVLHSICIIRQINGS